MTTGKEKVSENIIKVKRKKENLDTIAKDKRRRFRHDSSKWAG